MTPLRSIAPALAAGACLLAPAASGQACTHGIFYKNDSFPAVLGPGANGMEPMGKVCEGGGAGAVFQLGHGQLPQKIDKVAVGFGNKGAPNNKTALVNIEIYDGVDFFGAKTQFGPKVFDWNATTSSFYTLVSNGLNEIDLSGFDVKLEGAMGNYAVCFRLVQNDSGGNCANIGFNSSFLTDTDTPPPVFGYCEDELQKNLWGLQNGGWNDMSLAKETGGIPFPICPFSASGNWAIRVCAQHDANPLQIGVTGNPAPPGGTINLVFSAQGFAGVPYLAAASLGDSPGIPVDGEILPLNPDSLFALSLSDPATFSGFSGLIGASETAVGNLFVPNLPGVSGLSFFVAFVTIPPAPTPLGISGATPLTIL